MARAKHRHVREEQKFAKFVKDTERYFQHKEMLKQHKTRKKSIMNPTAHPDESE